MTLPEDGNVIRSDIQAELRAPPTAPEAQRAETEDHRRVFAHHPPHRRALRSSDRQSDRAVTDRLLHRTAGVTILECGQAGPVRAEVQLRARPAQTLGGTRPRLCVEGLSRLDPG